MRNDLTCSVCGYPEKVCKCEIDNDYGIIKCSGNVDDGSKYKRKIKGQTIDVYDVLKAFEVHNPAVQHALKKLLMKGTRGHKDYIKDLGEAVVSIHRAIQLEEE